MMSPNLALLFGVANALGPLREDLVFVGGCATALLITDPAAPPVRATTDVDAIAHVISTADYYGLSERLRQRGFHEDTTPSSPLCRWRYGTLLLDVMPTAAHVLGFTNRWYDAARQHRLRASLGEIALWHVSAPYFIATKIEAFHQRGHGDWLASHDLEDILTILDGRPELVDEVLAADTDVRRFIAHTFAAWLHDVDFLAALPGHLAAAPGRDRIVRERMRRLLATDEPSASPL